MTKIIHLSDLHFGRDRPELISALLLEVENRSPDLVVISGDLTQRAFKSQFHQAQQFLSKLAAPFLVVPGNHDVPFYNLFARLFFPFRCYRKFIDLELSPVWENDKVFVLGINTVDPMAIQRGKLSHRYLDQLALKVPEDDRFKLAVMHHPMEHHQVTDKELMQGASLARRALEEMGIDAVVSGHLHSVITEPFRDNPKMLFVQAGTALSTRIRGDLNSFNSLEIDPNRVVSQPVFAGTDDRFINAPASLFIRTEGVWDQRT